MARSITRVAALLLPVAGLLLISGGAQAEELQRRVVAVIQLTQDVSGDELVETKETVAATVGVIQALNSKKNHPDLVLQDLHRKLNTGGEGANIANIANGRTFYEAGVKAFKSGDMEETLDQLDSALQLWERSFVYLPRSRDFKELLLYLGQTQLKLELEKQAEITFQRAAVMGAKSKWVGLSGDGLTLFNAARARMFRLPSGTLEIMTEPENVEVYVDGRFKGVSPLNVANVLQGKHIVTLKKLGYKRVTRTVDVAGGEEPTELLEDLAFARKNILMKQLFAKLPTAVAVAERSDEKVGGEAINLIRRMLRCDIGVLLRVKTVAGGQEVDALVFDTDARKLLNRHSEVIKLQANLRNRNAFRAFTRKLMDFDYAVALGGATDPGPVVVEDGGIISKWWFWTAIGAAVLGATAGTVYYVVNQVEPPPFGKDGSGAIVLSF